MSIPLLFDLLYLNTYIYICLPTSQSINQSINPSINQSIHPSINQSINQSLSVSLCTDIHIQKWQEQTKTVGHLEMRRHISSTTFLDIFANSPAYMVLFEMRAPHYDIPGNIDMCMYIYIDIYIYVHIHINTSYIYIFICI